MQRKFQLKPLLIGLFKIDNTDCNIEVFIRFDTFSFSSFNNSFDK